jgi:hypothetical protein
MGISDHFVGTREQWRYGNADRLGSLRINDQLKLGWGIALACFRGCAGGKQANIIVEIYSTDSNGLNANLITFGCAIPEFDRGNR